MTHDEIIKQLAEIERNANHDRDCGGWRGPEHEQWWEGPCSCWKGKVVAMLDAQPTAVTGEAAQHAETLRELANNFGSGNPTFNGFKAGHDPNRQRAYAACRAGAEALAAPPAAGAPPCPSCVSEFGKPDPACATCHGSGRCPSAAAPPALVALVREWQEARKPAKLADPGVDLVATYQAAVKRMTAADEALAAYDLNGPAGGALVGQTEPTESTGPYLCACTCGCVDLTIQRGRCMVCRVRQSCLKTEWTCEACAAGYRIGPWGVHYDHDDSTWGVCRKIVSSFRRAEP